MVIAGLVVETLPACTDTAAQDLAAIEGVDVHEVNGRKVVVVLEAETVDAAHAAASGFAAIPGVTGVNVVYCNFEDDPTLAPAR